MTEHASLVVERYDDVLARLRGPHEVGRPCPRKPWMTPTTLDLDKGKCGACGEEMNERLGVLRS